MSSPLVWFVIRGSGVVLVVVLALALALGVLSTGRAGSRWWPRFVTQGLHRNLALAGLALALAHVVLVVVDDYVDIRWWQALLPFRPVERPVWGSFGTVAFELMLVVVVTSLARHRLGHTAWRWVHLSAYAVFVLGVAHGLGMGTDAREPWSIGVTLASVVVVLVATASRLVVLRRAPGRAMGTVAR